VVFPLFVLSLINLPLRRYLKTLSLTGGELLTIYVRSYLRALLVEMVYSWDDENPS